MEKILIKEKSKYGFFLAILFLLFFIFFKELKILFFAFFLGYYTLTVYCNKRYIFVDKNNLCYEVDVNIPWFYQEEKFPLDQIKSFKCIFEYWIFLGFFWIIIIDENDKKRRFLSISNTVEGEKLIEKIKKIITDQENLTKN